ncbi:hypothetical protein FJY90_03505 [Candidatus Gottesmanbacteria bacterium]|nr:hypothetical protein [Candidatus Gottesmanbacteria bacterium]
MLNELERRIIDLSYKYRLSHIGSSLSTINYLDEIYKIKNKDEPFILSNGHAGLALYVVLEKYNYKNAEYLIRKHGTHPNRNLDDGIWCSTGSLGMGLSVAIGMALADRNKNVYVTISDGECAEGSIWESLRIANDFELRNLKITCIANGFSALGKIDLDYLKNRLKAFYTVDMVRIDMSRFPDWLQGLEGHYHVITKEEYEKIICQ